MVNTFVGTLEFAKVLITIFIMFYAYFFLRRTEDYEERRPWQYLFIGSMFLFLVEVIATLQLFRGGLFHDQFFIDLRQFLEFGFLAFFLFSFIYQHHMLLKKGSLLIEEKPRKVFTGKNLWEKVKQEYLEIEEKSEKMLKEREEGEDPEEELKEELEGLDEDEELKKEEDEIEKIVEESEKND